MAFTQFESRSFTVGLFVLFAIIALYFDLYISLLYGFFSFSALIFYGTSHLKLSPSLNRYNDLIVRMGLAGIIIILISGVILLLSAFVVNSYFIFFICRRFADSPFYTILYLLMVGLIFIGIIWTLVLYSKSKKVT